MPLRKIIPMSQMTEEDRAEVAAYFQEAHVEQTAKVLGIPRDRIRVDVRWDEDDGGLIVLTFVDGEEFDANSEDGLKVVDAVRGALKIPLDPKGVN